MKQKKAKQLNPFILKVVIAITFLLGAFLYRNIPVYALYLKIFAWIIVMVSPVIKSVKNFQNKKENNELLEIFIGIVMIFINRFTEAIIFLLVCEIRKFIEDKDANQTEMVTVKKKRTAVEIPLSSIKKDMVLCLEKGEVVPVDSILETKEAICELFYSKKKFSTKTGDKIPAGSKILTEAVEIKTIEGYKESKWQKEQTKKKKVFKKLEVEAKNLEINKRIILILAGLFCIFIPNFITRKIQTKIIYLGILFLTLILMNSFQKTTRYLQRKMIEKLFLNHIQIQKYEDIKKIPNVKSIVFEKTKTLTLGEFRVTEVNSKDEKRLLEALNYVEYHVSSPIADAIKDYQTIAIEPKKIKDFKEYPSRGIECKVGKDKIVAGNLYYLKDLKIEVEKEMSVGTVIYVAIGKNYIGNVVLSDSIKCSIKGLTQELEREGIQTISVLSGDNERINKAICQELNIKDQYSNLTILEKEFWMKHLKEQKKGYMMMVGSTSTEDSLLALSDISVILEQDQLVDKNSSIYITENQLEKLPNLFKIVKKYKRTQHQLIALNIGLISVVSVVCYLEIVPIWMIIIIDFLAKVGMNKKTEKEW